MRENPKALHVLHRLAFGPRPGDIQHVNRIGAERYIDQQLRPESIPVPDRLSARMRQLNTLWMTPVELAREYGPSQIAGGRKQAPEAVKAARQRSDVIMEQAVEARFKREIEGPRQPQEVMVDFWFNHFNVFAGKGLDHLWTGAFEQQAIRPHTMGRFRELLGATAKHPSMLFYLDNWRNTAPDSPGPGLSSAELYQGRDLAVTTDFRSVITAVLERHIGLTRAQLGRVFPGYAGGAGGLDRMLA